MFVWHYIYLQQAMTPSLWTYYWWNEKKMLIVRQVLFVLWWLPFVQREVMCDTARINTSDYCLAWFKSIPIGYYMSSSTGSDFHIPITVHHEWLAKTVQTWMKSEEVMKAGSFGNITGCNTDVVSLEGATAMRDTSVGAAIHHTHATDPSLYARMDQTLTLLRADIKSRFQFADSHGQHLSPSLCFQEERLAGKYPPHLRRGTL